jgi:hypothetical protein
MLNAGPGLRTNWEWEMLNEVESKDLRRSVAYYLYIASKDVPDEQAGLYRAAALALIKKPVDATLLQQAGRRDFDDEPLYKLHVETELEDLWEQRHRQPIA